jgi:hypothetical protein
LASLKKYRYLAECRIAGKMTTLMIRWNQLTLLKDTMTLLKEWPMVADLQYLVDKILYSIYGGHDPRPKRFDILGECQ